MTEDHKVESAELLKKLKETKYIESKAHGIEKNTGDELVDHALAKHGRKLVAVKPATAMMMIMNLAVRSGIRSRT